MANRVDAVTIKIEENSRPNRKTVTPPKLYSDRAKKE